MHPERSRVATRANGPAKCAEALPFPRRLRRPGVGRPCGQGAPPAFCRGFSPAVAGAGGASDAARRAPRARTRAGGGALVGEARRPRWRPRRGKQAPQARAARGRRRGAGASSRRRGGGRGLESDAGDRRHRAAARARFAPVPLGRAPERGGATSPAGPGGAGREAAAGGQRGAGSARHRPPARAPLLDPDGWQLGTGQRRLRRSGG
jgi:hypothetical protein